VETVVGSGAYGRLPVVQDVQHQAERHKIKLLVLPTIDAIEVSKREPRDSNAILHVTLLSVSYRVRCSNSAALTLTRNRRRLVASQKTAVAAQCCATFLSLFFTHRKERIPCTQESLKITSKSGKARELCSLIEDKVVPILKKQAGFVDETILISDAEPNRVLGLSFWNSKEDAERYYHQEEYPQIHETLKHLLETEPVIRTFDVQASTTHRITARKAA
jgi:heme-degrading monooxygenase HmoA